MNYLLEALYVAAAFVGLYWFAISRLYPGKIVFIEHASIELFSSIVRRFPEVKIKYEGASARSNLILLVGSIMNNGRIDVEPKEGEDKLQLKLPEGFRWVTARAVRRSPQLKMKVMALDQLLVFDFKLLKKGEIVQFEAICEVSRDYYPSVFLPDLIDIHHRIPQTARVGKIRAVSQTELLRTIRQSWLAMGFIAILVLFGLSLATYQYFFENSHVLHVYSAEGKSILVRATPVNERQVHLRGIQSDFEKNISLTQFSDPKMFKPTVGRESFFYFLVRWFDRLEYTILFVAVGALMSLQLSSKYIKANKLIARNTEEVTARQSA